MKNCISAFLFLLSLSALAQSHTISGYISDSETGEKLIHAYIYDRITNQGTRTNDYGFYSITTSSDSIRILISYVGYKPIERVLFFEEGDESLNIALKSDNLLEEVTVTASESAPIQEETQMSSISLDVKQIRNLPVLLGETDLLKTVQLLPGVQSGSEGSSGFYVRGGGPDQNLVLIDGVPVYNVSHLFGFFSIFNGDAIKSVELIKGGFPAEYGGRLSSVLDIRMKEGNMNEYHGEGSIGLISSKFTFEGPIVKDQTSFLISARRTYIDVLAAPLIAAQGNGNSFGYYFYDLNGKVNHRINDDHHLYLSVYNGRDKASSSQMETDTDDGLTYESEFESNLAWGNLISNLRWNWKINSQLFMNTSASYTRYNFDVGFRSEERLSTTDFDSTTIYGIEYLSEIEDVGIRTEFDWYPIANHEIKFGAAYINHTFRPGINTESYSDGSVNNDTTYGSTVQLANEFQAYFRDDFRIGDRWKLNLGVHTALFNVNNENYFSAQPRIAARYLLDEHSSLKGSFATMTQFLHLLTNQTVGLPTDLWVPATDQIGPQQSWQAALGYARSLPYDFQFSTEVYYKEMNNLIEYKEGAGFFTGGVDWQDKVTVGRGWGYGLELLLERKVGRTTGWVGYTLSYANRQFDEVNFGNTYPYTYDRRHDLSVALTHQLSESWVMGVVFVYGTGNAITLPTAQYRDPYTGEVIDHTSERNNYRAPAYHRLDLSFTKTNKVRWGESIWQFGVYNIYNRQNPFYLYFQESFSGRELRQVSLFPILPSVSWSFKF